MMNKLVTGSILKLIGFLMSGDLLKHIEELVLLVSSSKLSGAEKKAQVLEGLQKLGGDLGAAVASTAPYLINLAVEAAVANIKARAS